MTSEAVSLFQQLIRNACVNDGTPESGHEHRSVRTLLDFFGTAGEIFEPVPGRQSLIYRIEGTDPTAPSLALVPHLDVVPVQEEGWSHDPFGAEIVDGFVYGRGAIDMLNVTAAMAVAARPYIQGDKEPRGDLVFVGAADEEAGGVHGAHALVDERWDLVGADYLLTEVAYPSPSYVTGPTVPVAVGEKGAFWSVLKSSGTPGHGSAPYQSDNALQKMVEALHGIFEAPVPVGMSPEWVRFVEALSLDADMKAALVDPDRIDEAIGMLAVTDPPFARYVHAITHMTVSPNVLKAGMKANVIADAATANVDVRALPDMDRDYVDSYLQKSMGRARDEIDISPVSDFEATLSPTDNLLWEAIADGVEELEGHRNLLPTLMNVGTDARFFRKKGTIAHGVGLYDDLMTFSEMLALFHGHDERVPVDSVDRTVRLYEKVLHNFFEAS